MALARLLSRGQLGLQAYEVVVEVHLAGGLPGFSMTGLPAAAVRESKDRVRAALQTSGISPPRSRITVHLGPADIPKDGARFDLPIALGLAKAEKGYRWKDEQLEFIGELALSGEIRPVRGVLPAVVAARDANRAIVLPRGNSHEAALVDGAEAYAAGTLAEVLSHLNGQEVLSRVEHEALKPPPAEGLDLRDVRGQPMAKRALLLAAAGGHNLLMIGPPGSGKSMLAERLRGLLPPLGLEDRLCIASIASLAGNAQMLADCVRTPVRSPHHTISAAALIGGGAHPRPGEVSLAHRGILFLDELPEFSRTALETLREPLESGVARISRVHGQIVFPAQFQLIAAMNPCPCGYLGDESGRCRCSQAQIARYRARISGPLLERIDMHVDVPRVACTVEEPIPTLPETPALAARVADVRRRQLENRGCLNSRLTDAALNQATMLGHEARSLLQHAVNEWRLSMRSYARVLKLALTIADFEGSDEIAPRHIGEALQLRRLDRSSLNRRADTISN